MAWSEELSAPVSTPLETGAQHHCYAPPSITQKKTKINPEAGLGKPNARKPKKKKNLLARIQAPVDLVPSLGSGLSVCAKIRRKVGGKFSKKISLCSPPLLLVHPHYWIAVCVTSNAYRTEKRIHHPESLIKKEYETDTKMF